MGCKKGKIIVIIDVKWLYNVMFYNVLFGLGEIYVDVFEKGGEFFV